MASEVKIDDIAIQPAKGSLKTDGIIEERGVAEFSVVDIGGLSHYQKGQPILIYDPDATLIFGGSIHSSEETRVGANLYHYIRCIDYHYAADKRLAAESYLNKTAGFIFDDLFDKYLAPEGITIGEIQTGPTILEAVINYVRISDAYDALGELAGFIWYIDELKRLYFIARATNTAPWAAATSDMIKGTPRLLHSNPKYRNRQYIRGGRGTTDLQEETFTGDGVRVAFTVGFPLQKVPASVTVSGRTPVGQTIGIKGIDVAFDCYWNKGDATITFEVAPEDTETVVIQYYGQWDIFAEIEDPVAIAAQLAIEGGGTGYVDDIATEPTLDNQNASIDSGIAKLAKFAMLGKRFTYQTTRSGLKPGQLQTTNYPLLGLNNAEMLIEAVKVRARGELITYDITEVQGPTTGGWSRLFKVLATEVERLQVGTDQTLILLTRASEAWGWKEEVVVSVFACPVPRVTLYPAAATLFPC